MFDEILRLLTASSALHHLQVVELIAFGQNAFLSGNPISDLPIVLSKIQDYLHRQHETQ